MVEGCTGRPGGSDDKSSGYNHTLQLAMQTHRQLGTGKDTVVNGRLQCRLNDVMGSHR